MIQSVQRALRVLEALVDLAPQAVLGDVARAVDLTPPTTYRILQTLVAEGFATARDGGAYEPGPKVLVLAGQMVTSMDYSLRARPALLALQEHTQETIHFGILAGDHAQYVDKIEGRRPYRLASVVGMGLQLHCTAIGKAILAYLPPARSTALVTASSLEARTRRTITDPDRLDEELGRIRAQGFCIDDEEDREGVRCVGAPVFDHHGEVLGAISVSAPTFQLSVQDALALAPHVVAAAQATSASLGATIDAPPDGAPSPGGTAATDGTPATDGDAR